MLVPAPAPDGNIWPAGGMASTYAYETASPASQELGFTYPYMRLPDSEINPYRDRMVGHLRDLARNSGWGLGGVTRILDNTIARRR